MGTRNLTCVIQNGEFKVAQYGQWDGYPTGQGNTILGFLQKWNRKKFEKNLGKCQWIDTIKLEEMWKAAGAGTDGLISCEKANEFGDKYPQFDRDTGADILSFIQKQTGSEPILLQDSRNFASDSLFCEWAYVLNLDKDNLEIYKGFRCSPTKTGRFKDYTPRTHERGNTYYPIKLYRKYKFTELPEQFSGETLPKHFPLTRHKNVKTSSLEPRAQKARAGHSRARVATAKNKQDNGRRRKR